MATGGGQIERGVTSGRSEKGPKEPDFWKAADAGNKGLDRESQIRMKTAPTDAPFECDVIEVVSLPARGDNSPVPLG